MAKGICTNFGNCNNADGRKEFDIIPGSENKCPECGRDLREVKPNPPKDFAKYVILGILILLAGAGMLFYQKLKTPHPPMKPEVASGLNPIKSATDSGPTPTPETKSETKTETSPLPKPETKSETKPETKPETKSEPTQKAEPSTAPESAQANAPKTDREAVKEAIHLVSNGLLLVKQNKLSEAEAAFKAAAQKDPDNDQAFGNLGTISISLGKPDEGMEPLRKAIELNPYNYVWRLNMAKVYSLSGDKEKAIFELRSAIDHGSDKKQILKQELRSSDFNNIRNEEAFVKLMQKLK
ncbi:MAG: hypothetical protein HQK89_02600 [Nitrospirae bacterium]|nr:hypothetical protein [Nitrospirota bacterium]